MLWIVMVTMLLEGDGQAVNEIETATYIPDPIHRATAPEAGFVPSSEIDDPFLLALELGSELALEIADADALNHLAGDRCCAAVQGVRHQVVLQHIKNMLG